MTPDGGPILFLDVDGTLLPYGGDPAGRLLVAGVGPRLGALLCELVWATTWGEQANDELADADRQWVRTQHAGAAFLRQVQPYRGVTDEDLAALEDWLQWR
ncbi:hypothetical protein ABZX12_02270 [Kribbella sp. NPDC003505]|uniref:hypothetical protein n=1 Tax=Kribbella sp. NPDC003505 TaxID=3154448 RepID=UPI0033AE30DD